MTVKADVAIIGAGVVGAAIARELARYDLRVVLIEREVEAAFGTSKANSGVVHAGFHSTPGTLKASLCVQGNAMFDDIAGELSVPFRRNGSLMVAMSTDEVGVLREHFEQGRRNGVPGLRLLDADEARKSEPGLAPEVVAALYAPTGGVVCPFQLTFALVENAVANGGAFMAGSPVTSIHLRDGRVAAVETPEAIIETAWVVNAAGLFADRIAAMAGDESFEIRPRKGEEYLLDKRVGSLVRSTVFPVPTAVSKGILVIPTVDGNIMVGPTAEDTRDRLDLTTTRAGFEAVFAAARRMVPSVSPRDIIASFAGLRAACSEDDFIIRPSRVARGLVHVAGIESPGLTAAPAIARMVAEILREEGLKMRARRAFNPVRPAPVRFAHLSRAQQARLVASDPAFGRIVCRCETVTEAEVVDAIRRGARTVDGVKLRTRAGMGRCQGGFCLPRVMKILSRELGIPVEHVTKRGPGSVIAPYPAKALLRESETRSTGGEREVPAGTMAESGARVRAGFRTAPAARG
ncbi:MAG: NAD(P)/FAD-dependent oxidoreductase [Bacillota bacterium]|nr:NAD(P)/FAD-dependent oxidoreductase [Bacillota bacterium]